MFKKLKCFASKFKRLKYFHGMLLTENDFQEEQIYFREKIKLHNRLHGQGVVWGLGLKAKQENNKYTSKIFIEPGFALDCHGNEIIVCRDHEVDLKDKIETLEKLKKIASCASPPGSSAKIYIGIKYCECDSEPVAQYTSECSSDELQAQFSRTKEGFVEALFAEDELPPCSEKKQVGANAECVQSGSYCPGAKPCYENEHVIILGFVEIDCSNKYEIKDSQINLICMRKYAFAPSSEVTWPFPLWEGAKHALINMIAQEKKLNDISVLIGLQVETAINRLEEMGISNPVIMTLSDLIKTINPRDKAVFRNIIMHILFGLPYLPSNDIANGNIVLITDDSRMCVIFPLFLEAEIAGL